MSHILQDLRFAIRLALKNPGFTVAAIAILALAIGTTTPTFSMMNAYLLRPLPFGTPERLVHLWSTNEQRGWSTQRVSVPDFLDWRRDTTSLEDLAAFNYTAENLTGSERPEQISAGRVSANVFEVLEREPILGRAFARGEDLPGAEPVVVLSHSFWMTRYAGAENVIGTVLEINETPYTIIGVMPDDFVFPLPTTRIWIPRTLDPDHYGRDRQILQVVGRLKEGVSHEEAGAEMTAIANRLSLAHPEDRDRGVNIVDLRSALNFADEIFRAMWIVLLAAHGFVLLIACANISGLLLARAIRREKEAGIRTALGARRGRLVQQLLVESVVLSIGGGVAGLAIAWGLIRIIVTTMPDDLYRVGEIELDPTAVLFTLLIAFASSVVFGLIPALRISGIRVNRVLRESSGTSTTSRRSLRLQKSFVIAQTALAVALLICTGLMIRSFDALRKVDPGFDQANVLTLTMRLWHDRYDEQPGATAEFHRQSIQEASRIPGVVAAATVDYLPLNHETTGVTVEVPGVTTDPSSRPEAYLQVVSPGYFDVMKIQILEGSDFAESDGPDSPRRVVINEQLARRFWPEGTAVGHSLDLGGHDETFEVVGVVANSTFADLSEPEKPQVYLSQYQLPDRYMRLLVRTENDPLSLVSAVEAAVWRVDPDLPISSVRTMGDIVQEFLLPQAAMSTALLILSLGAVLLAAIGLYGLISFFVNQGRREIGIRLAVGASTKDVLKLVLFRGLRLAMIGIVLGLVGALALARLMSSLLFGVSALDPVSFVAVPALLALVAIAAVLVPARRAARLDPFAILRVD